MLTEIVLADVPQEVDQMSHIRQDDEGFQVYDKVVL